MTKKNKCIHDAALYVRRDGKLVWKCYKCGKEAERPEDALDLILPDPPKKVRRISGEYMSFGDFLKRLEKARKNPAYLVNTKNK